jgi:hypothetical protein
VPNASQNRGLHYIGVAPVSYGADGTASIQTDHLRFAPEFGERAMRQDNFAGRGRWSYHESADGKVELRYYGGRGWWGRPAGTGSRAWVGPFLQIAQADSAGRRGYAISGLGAKNKGAKSGSSAAKQSAAAKAVLASLPKIPADKAVKYLGRKPLLGKFGKGKDGRTLWRVAAPTREIALSTALMMVKKLHGLKGAPGAEFRKKFPVAGEPVAKPAGIIPAPNGQPIILWVISWPDTATVKAAPKGAPAPKQGALKRVKYVEDPKPSPAPGTGADAWPPMAADEGSPENNARYDSAVQRLLADEFGRDPYKGYFNGCGCGR